MKVKVENAGPCRKVLAVEIPKETVTTEWDAMIRVFIKETTVPGYRKGRAPEHLIERHYRKAIGEEVRDRLIGRFYHEALKQEQLNPVSVMDVQNSLPVKDEMFSFKVVLDVPPDFKLPKYKGLTLKDKKKEITDTDVEDRFNQLLDQNARYEPIEERPIQKGDLAQMDFQATVDEKPMGEVLQDVTGLDKGKDFWSMTDDHELLPGLGANLIGLRKGETKTFSISFPAGYAVKSLAGLSARYEVAIKAIREKKPPILDEAFLKQFEVTSVDALRAMVRDACVKEAELQEKERLKDEIIQVLLSKTSIDLPDSLVQEETRHMFYDLVRRNMMRGMTREQVDEKKDEFLKLASGSAGEKVKLGYILHRIADEEKITVEDAEVDKTIRTLASRYQTTPERLREELEERKELETIKNEIRMNKTVELILDNAKVAKEGFFNKLIGD